MKAAKGKRAKETKIELENALPCYFKINLECAAGSSRKLKINDRFQEKRGHHTVKLKKRATLLCVGFRSFIC